MLAVVISNNRGAACIKPEGKFREKHLCQSLFFNKVAGLTPAIL